MTWPGVLIISTLGALLAGGFVALFWPSTYTATSSFFVSDPAELLATMLKDVPPTGSGLPEAGKLKPTQDRLQAILSSRLLRSELVTKHRLAERFGKDPTEAEELLARMAKINPIGEEGFSIEVTCRGYSRVRTLVSHTLGREEARQLCAALANDYLNSLETYVTKTAISEARKKREFIETAQRQVLGQLRQAQNGIQRLQVTNDFLDPSDKAALLADRIKNLQQGVAEAAASTDQTKSSLTRAQGQLGRVGSMRIASIVQTRNPVIAQVEQKLADLNVELATQEAQGKTRQNRDVVQILSAIETANQELARLKQDVQKEVSQGANPTYDKIVGQVVDLQVAQAGAHARHARLKQMLAQADRDLAHLPPVARQFAFYKQDQDIQFSALNALKQSLAVAMVQEQQSKRAGEFLVLDTAIPPPDIYGPPIWWAIGLTFAGLLCIFGMSLLNRMIFGT